MGAFTKGNINLSKDDLRRIGVKLEKIKLNLKDKGFGKFDASDLSEYEIAALYILDGMVKYQEESNIGIKMTSKELELYDYRKRQETIDNVIKSLNFIRDTK